MWSILTFRLRFPTQPFIVWEKLIGTWSTISIFQSIQAVMPTLRNLTVNSITMLPSTLFLATAKLEPLKKLSSRFSRIYVQTLVTEIGRRTTRKSKLCYDMNTTVSRSKRLISEIQFLEGWSVRENEISLNFEKMWLFLWDTGVPYDNQSTVFWFRVNYSYNALLSTS